MKNSPGDYNPYAPESDQPMPYDDLCPRCGFDPCRCRRCFSCGEPFEDEQSHYTLGRPMHAACTPEVRGALRGGGKEPDVD